MIPLGTGALVHKNSKEIGFAIGFPPIKAEGEIAHPDIYDNSYEMPDEWYLRQLQGYKDWAGDIVYDTICTRPKMLKLLK